MQTQIPEAFAKTADGQTADRILRACVHCGFCTAVCPTYRLLGNELDSPRGRIYLIKAALENEDAGEHTRTHLERCLGCRACETVCPSQVEYHHLLDIGKEALDRSAPPSLFTRASRALMLNILGNAGLFAALVKIGQFLKPVLPRGLAAAVPHKEREAHWPASRHERKLSILSGCVQSAIAPQSNAAAARILDRAEMSAESISACCGALYQHSGDPERALAIARENIDRWTEELTGYETLLIAASGCAAHVRDYAWLLRGDSAYLSKWRAIESRVLEASEFLDIELITRLINNYGLNDDQGRVSFHAPCSMRHGLKRDGPVEQILSACGYEIAPVAEQGTCCGSAGTYSLRHPKLARELRDARIQTLEQGQPDFITTANVGCQHHLQSGTSTPVLHWLQAVDAALGRNSRR